MKKLLIFFSGSFLLKGSLIVFVGSVFSNFGSYLFHLIMGRLLGPVDYGVLESLISLMYFLGIPMGVLGITIVKYLSQNSKEKNFISSFLTSMTKKVTFLGLSVLLIFFLLFPLMKNLVRINSFFLFFGLGISSFLSIYVTIFSSALQGVMKFVHLSIFSVFNIWIKLIISIVLVLCGFKVGGAVYGGVLAAVVSIIFGYFLITKHLTFNLKQIFKIKTSLPHLGAYSFTVFISNLSLTSFYTIDIILARYFLSPLEAGQYASLSVLGKIVFFASNSIVSVMFPMVSEKQSRGEDYRKLFGLSFFIVLMISLTISAVYFIFPQQMIGFLFGSSFLGASGNLGLFAVFISIYSICSLLMNFYLSIFKSKPIFLSFIFAVSQIILILFFHQSIGQIVRVNIGVLFLLALMLLAFFPGKFLQRGRKMIQS